MRPPTLLDLIGSPLLRQDATDCIPSGDPLACMECWDCQYWDSEEAGTHCAMEAAVMIGNATPELARLFGWSEDEQQRGFWYGPDRCPWFRDKSEAWLPIEDPRQLSLLDSEAA